MSNDRQSSSQRAPGRIQMELDDDDQSDEDTEIGVKFILKITEEPVIISDEINSESSFKIHSSDTGLDMDDDGILSYFKPLKNHSP